jgi:hypothetical protein
MSGAQIGKSGMNLGVPLGALTQWAWDPSDGVKLSLICGSTITPVLRALPGDRFYLARSKDYHFRVVSPTVYPFYVLAEYPTEIKVFVVSGPIGGPQEILGEITKLGNRRDILFVLKDLSKSDSPCPLHDIDLLEVASRIADGTLKLPPPKEYP